MAEQLIRLRYSVLVIDPEGDHVRLGELPDVLVVGGREGLPTPERLANLLALRIGSVVADLSFLSREDGNRYLRDVAPGIERQRLQKGLPHWVVVDEAHGALGSGGAVAQYLALGAKGYLLVSYRPEELSERALGVLDSMNVVAGGPQAGIGQIVRAMAGFANEDPTAIMARLEGAGAERALLASRGDRCGSRTLRVGRRTTSYVRHWHKYATLEQPPNYDSFSGEVPARESPQWRATSRSSIASSAIATPRWYCITPGDMTFRAGSKAYFVIRCLPQRSKRSRRRRRQPARGAIRSATNC